jgi:hypothetical protein
MAESDFYERIEECLRRLFETAGASVYLEIAANSGFSEKLKQAIPHGKEIVFKFLQLRPDIAGFVEEQYMKSLITVEVKEKSLTLEDIYQARLYKEVFEAKYGFLVTLSPIQEELKRLCKGNFDILRSAADGVYRFLAIAQFNNASGEFSDWFEENPFEQPRYWKR